MGDCCLDRKLFTPGPLGCSAEVKASMLRDIGSREPEFISSVANIRKELLNIAGLCEKTWACILLQGSGTFSVEAAIQTATPKKNGKVLILSNGAYGHRFGDMCVTADIPYEYYDGAEDTNLNVAEIKEVLQKRGQNITTIAAVHHETSNGALNPIAEIGKLVRTYANDAAFVVDAMSSFGGVEFDVGSSGVDFLVSSANKCLQGVPGFAFVLAKRSTLEKCKGNCRVLSLDLISQLEGLEKNGQFRFTPPTHCILAFKTALEELKNEGGVTARARRYRENDRILMEGMRKLGFKTLLSDDQRGYVISSFYFPNHEKFTFNEFYLKLYEKKQVIYPGKLSKKDCFRIGSIGYLFPSDIKYLLSCIEEVLNDIGIPIPVP